jgi:CheY-like chemotaxis protein/tetratricopeptide (TPR) repeat protein
MASCYADATVTLRILIVEDDRYMRRILETVLANDPELASRSLDIVFAEDGRRGLEVLASGPFSLVISDLLVPRMDGFHFCRELRRHPHGREVPLLVTSAIFKQPADISKLQSECNAEFFAKPFQMKELLGRVRQLLTAKQGVLPSTSRPPPLRSGMLGERNPARILLELWEQRAIGSLVVVRGRVKKEIVLLHGAPVAVHSNLRSETLGRVLVTRSRITERQHRDALERAQLVNEKLGSVLLQANWITEEELLTQLGVQMRQKISHTLRWKEGEWQFLPTAPLADRLQIPIDTPRLVFSGLHKSGQIDQLTQRFAHEGGRVALTLLAERYRDPFTALFGDGGLEKFGRCPTLDEILADPNPGPLVVQLDVLLACGMAEIEPAGVTLRRSPRRTHEGMTLSQLAQEALKPAALSIGLPKNLLNELFGDEQSDNEFEGLPPAALGDDRQELSGVMELPTGDPARHPSNVDSPAETNALRREILSEYLAIHGKDFYQVLRLPREAEPEDIAEAYAQFGKRFRLDRFARFDLGRDYARVEEIHQIFRQAFETLSGPERRADYDRLLCDREPYKRASLTAELSATRALTLLEEGNLKDARRLFEEAVAEDPNQADYHALLGWTAYLSEAGQNPTLEVAKAASKTAWPHLATAFSIDPDHLDTHDFAGRIAAMTEEDERAISHLERVLDIEPTRTTALETLELSLSRRGDWRGLERQYRRLLAQFAELRDRKRAHTLWWRLAELYQTHLVDRDSARLAYQTAGLLDSDDPRPREALAQLFGQDPTAWESTAAALRESWQLAPDDAQPGHRLFRLHVEGQRWDAAFAVASVLASRGIRSGESADFYHRHRSRLLVRSQGPITPSLLERVRHPDDQPLLGELFARLFALHRPVITLADLGLRAADAFPHEALPTPFQRTLDYVAQALAVPIPTVYRRPGFSTDLYIGATDPPILLAGAQALAFSESMPLAFRLGRALAYLFSFRAVTSALPNSELKRSLLSSVTIVSPGLRVDDPGGKIADLRALLLSANPHFAREMKDLVHALLAACSGRLNLSLYVRGMARTADRIGLLLSKDVPAAAEIVSQEGAPGAENDLLDFALSEEYLTIRAELGLSIL